MTLLLTQARANRLANRRLLAAVAMLPDAEFHAPRTSFFPSLALTLNHVLNVDHYYIAALHGDAAMRHVWAGYVPAQTAAELAKRQDASDQRLIAFCETLTPADDERIVAFDRGPEAVAELAGHLATGRLKSREDVVQGGVAAFPDALNGLFAGRNFGKLVLHVAD